MEIVDLATLLYAKPEAVVRLARALGLPTQNRTHAELCYAIDRWYQDNPAPLLKPSKRPRRRTRRA